MHVCKYEVCGGNVEITAISEICKVFLSEIIMYVRGQITHPLTVIVGRATAQMVSRWLPTAEAQVQTRV
jgi:hypothetical protein